MLAVNKLAESSNCIFEFDVLSFKTSELLGNVERLLEELLNLSSTRHNQFIFVRQFI